MLPDIDSGTSGEIVAENIRAVETLYVAWQLEQVHAFEVADRLAGLFSEGLLPLGGGGGAAAKLQHHARDHAHDHAHDHANDHAHEDAALTSSERAQCYASVFGARVPGSDPDATPNREFDSLLLRFVAAVALFTKNRNAANASDPLLSDVQTRSAAQSLAANVSARGVQLAPMLAARVAAQVDALIGLLGDPEITSAFGARDLWQVIDTVSNAELGGASNVERHRERSQGGSTVLQWLAARSDEIRETTGTSLGSENSPSKTLSSDSSPIDSSLSDGSLSDSSLRDKELISATVQWLGAGTSALFAGERGTGKTIAAHALASALGRELFRVDLGSIVSKFIGETEKNLNALLAEAEQTGAVLLLDEADALFGPRTNVADAHDRFSDDERRRVLRDACCAFEAHSGVVILESRSAADTAWHAHMAQVVRFPLALAWGDG